MKSTEEGEIVSFDFERLRRQNYYDWRQRENIIGPIESYESWKARRVTPNLQTSQNSTPRRVKPERVNEEIVHAVSEFVINVEGILEDEIMQIATEAFEEVKALSPVYTGNNKKIKKGAYRKGWKLLSRITATGLKATIYNKHYQLTHLLENSHLNRDGTTYAAPKPHISVANRHAEEKVNRLLERL